MEIKVYTNNLFLTKNYLTPDKNYSCIITNNSDGLSYKIVDDNGEVVLK